MTIFCYAIRKPANVRGFHVVVAFALVSRPADRMFAREPSTVVDRIQHLDDLISLDLLLHLSSERHSRWNTSGFSGSV